MTGPETPAAGPESLPVERLFTMDLELSPFTYVPDGPHGTRVLCSVLGGTVEGPRVRGTVRPGGADWVTVRSSGVSRLDVRLLFETHDGATVLMEYGGIYDRPAGIGPRAAPLFQTGHAGYLWLNDLQAVSIGTPGKDSVSYEVYALR